MVVRRAQFCAILRNSAQFCAILRNSLSLPSPLQVRLAALKQESKVRVQTLNADGNLEVTKLAAEKERVLKDLHARAVSEAAQLKAETDLYEQETVSATEFRKLVKNIKKALMEPGGALSQS